MGYGRQVTRELHIISRDEAGRIAALEIAARGLGTGVGDIFHPDELGFRKPSLYGVTDLANCWIAYSEQATTGVIRSSMIVLISRSTGKVVYSGSANDEG